MQSKEKRPRKGALRRDDAHVPNHRHREGRAYAKRTTKPSKPETPTPYKPRTLRPFLEEVKEQRERTDSSFSSHERRQSRNGSRVTRSTQKERATRYRPRTLKRTECQPSAFEQYAQERGIPTESASAASTPSQATRATAKRRNSQYAANPHTAPTKKRRNARREGFSSRNRAPKRRQEMEPTRQTINPTHPIRLNRFIAHCGVCSRRDADTLIEQGLVTVNGATVTKLGSRIVPADCVVTCQGKTLSLERKVYILLNKPKDCFCTTDDPHATRTVLDIIEGACMERVYPVGRLDRNTTGLLLLTNDGDLTEKLTHPSYEKKKIYEVELDNPVTPEHLQQLTQGVQTDIGILQADVAEHSPESRYIVGIEIHSGQNRVVRRLFEALNYKVKRLDRVYYAGLTKKNLPRGQWRFLTPAEVQMLHTGRYN